MLLMDERTANLALRAMAHRMPHADVDALTPAVTRAWNTGYGGSPPWAAAMRAVVDATFGPAYRHGAAAGRDFTAGYVIREAVAARDRLTAAGNALPIAVRIMDTIAQAATAASRTRPTVRSPGPSRADYDVALGDYNDESQPGRAAAAARTGWSHGRAQGHADAAWSLMATVRQAVTREVGELALRRVEVEGRSAREWLDQLDARARYSAEAVEVSSIRSTRSVVHGFSVPDTATVSHRQAATSNGLTAAQLAAQDQAPGVAATPAGSANSRPRPASTTTTSTTRRRR
jgi:hypothetical protein